MSQQSHYSKPGTAPVQMISAASTGNQSSRVAATVAADMLRDKSRSPTNNDQHKAPAQVSNNSVLGKRDNSQPKQAPMPKQGVQHQAPPTLQTNFMMTTEDFTGFVGGQSPSGYYNGMQASTLTQSSNLQ